MRRAPVKRGCDAVAAGWRVLAAAALLLLMALAPLPLAVDEAEAQQRVQHRSIMEMLFGPRREAPTPPPPQRYEPRRQVPQRAAPRRSQPPSRGGGSRQVATPPEPTVEKNPDAAKVLVVGDFMASGLADGLEEAFAESSNVVILEETNGSSGLVRDDFYDWQAELPGILEQTDPDIVAVMLGSNDRQQLRVDGAAADVRTDAWNAEYARRVDGLAAIVTERDLPLIWVGAPAFESSRMSADILAINEIYRDRVTEANGTFVDIWDGFVDENGAFIFTGSDVEGQQVRLRGSDGINMTAAGKRKMAFYAERPIRRLLEEMIGVFPGGVASLPDSADQGDPLRRVRVKPKLVTRTPPMLINDPAFDGGTVLLGGEAPEPGELRSPRDRLVEDGLASAAPYGRADYFKWPPEKPEETSDPEGDPETVSSIDRPAEDAPADSSAAITTIIREAEGAL